MAGKAMIGWSGAARAGGKRSEPWNGRGRADSAKDKCEQKESDRRAREYYDRTGEWGWGPGG